MRRHFAVLALAFAVFSFSALRAQAVNTGTIGILPAYPDPNVRSTSSWFVYNLDKGQSKEDAVRIINNKEEPVVIKVYAVDATNTTDGSFALLPEDAPRTGVSSWVKLAVNEVEVPAKSEKLIPFTFSVPANVDVGDHMGGIVMQEVEGKTSGASGTGVKIVTRVGVRIYETVPGIPNKDYSIEKFGWQLVPNEKANFLRKLVGFDKKTIFFLGLENKGNIKISPKAQVDVINMFGKTVGTTHLGEIGDVFPGTRTTDSSVVWDGMPLFGRYVAKLSVSFVQEGLPEGNREIVIWAVPYRLLAILFILGVIAVLLYLSVQYWREAAKEAMPIYTVRDGETLGRIAEMFQLDWKKLSKTNNLKKPYEVIRGQKLFIPVLKKNLEKVKEIFRSGLLEPPLEKKSELGKGGKLKKRLIAVIVFLLIAAAAFGFYKYKMKVAQQNAPKLSSQNSEVENTKPEQSLGAELTSSGAVKKSSIKVSICTLPGAEWEASARLQDKLALAGYASKMETSLCDTNYQKTTVAHGPKNKTQAELVKGDLEANVREIEMVEKSNLEDSIIIYNRINKNDILKIAKGEESESAIRELTKVKIRSYKTDAEKLSAVKELMYAGGYDVEENLEEIEGSYKKGITILYANEEDLKRVANLKDYLEKNGFTVVSSKTEDIQLEAGSIVVVAFLG